MIKETILAYALLCDSSGFSVDSALIGLNAQVKQHIQEGWQPFESPLKSAQSMTVCQAVVKYQE